MNLSEWIKEHVSRKPRPETVRLEGAITELAKSVDEMNKRLRMQKVGDDAIAAMKKQYRK